MGTHNTHRLCAQFFQEIQYLDRDSHFSGRAASRHNKSSSKVSWSTPSAAPYEGDLCRCYRMRNRVVAAEVYRKHDHIRYILIVFCENATSPIMLRKSISSSRPSQIWYFSSAFQNKLSTSENLLPRTFRYSFKSSFLFGSYSLKISTGLPNAISERYLYSPFGLPEFCRSLNDETTLPGQNFVSGERYKRNKYP